MKARRETGSPAVTTWEFTCVCVCVGRTLNQLLRSFNGNLIKHDVTSTILSWHFRRIRLQWGDNSRRKPDLVHISVWRHFLVKRWVRPRTGLLPWIRWRKAQKTWRRSSCRAELHTAASSPAGRDGNSCRWPESWTSMFSTSTPGRSTSTSSAYTSARWSTSAACNSGWPPRPQRWALTGIQIRATYWLHTRSPWTPSWL